MLASGEAVDVAVEHEMLARRAAFERRDNVGEFGVRINDAVGDALRFEKSRDVRRCLARIAGWIGTLGLYELTQEGDEPIAIGIDMLNKLPLRAHPWGHPSLQQSLTHLQQRTYTPYIMRTYSL